MTDTLCNCCPVSNAAAAVLVLEGLDGRLFLQHEGGIIASQDAPPSPGALRSRSRTSSAISIPAPAPELASEPSVKAIELPGTKPDQEEDAHAAAIAAVAAAEPTEPPPKPTNLTARVNGDDSITLSWEAPDDDSVTGYRILRRRPTQGEATLLVYVSDTGSTTTTWTDTNVTAGIRQV